MPRKFLVDAARIPCILANKFILRDDLGRLAMQEASWQEETKALSHNLFITTFSPKVHLFAKVRDCCITNQY